MAKMYVDVKIPKEITDHVDDLIKEGILGYRSRGEFFSDAGRRRLEVIQEFKKIKKMLDLDLIEDHISGGHIKVKNKKD